MGKSKSGYKRGYADHASSGVWIEVKTEEAYQKLKACAQADGITIGQWVEASLRYALSGVPYIPPYRHAGSATPTKRARGFRLSDMTYAWVEAKAGEDGARAWIGKTLLSLATVQMTRIAGEEAEIVWAERYKV